MNRAFLVYNISKMLAEYEDSQDKTTNLNVKIMENAEKKSVLGHSLQTVYVGKFMRP